MYRRPMVENKSIAEVLSIILKPLGPINMPDKIKPIMPGIFNFPKIIGESKMIKRINEKIKTGL
jgi:hypothetical protein